MRLGDFFELAKFLPGKRFLICVFDFLFTRNQLNRSQRKNEHFE